MLAGVLARASAVALLAVGLASPRIARAAAPLPYLSPDYVQTCWTVQDGLPVNSFTDMVQTRDGYLWIATFDGLARFDGHRFVVFNQSNTPILPSNRMIALEEASDGSLWITTQSSNVVHMTDPVSGWTVHDAGGNPDVVQILHLDREGTPWFGTEFGLSHLVAERIEGYARDRFSERVVGLFRDGAGNYWTYGPSGIVVVGKSDIQRFAVRPSGPDQVQGFYELEDGRVLIGGTGGLFERDGTRLREVNPNSLRPDQRIVAQGARNPHHVASVPMLLAVFGRAPGRAPRAARSWNWASDRDGTLWHSDRRQLYRGDLLIAEFDSPILMCLVDREGSIWAQTEVNGLYRLTPAILKSVATRVRDESLITFGVAEGGDGAMWIASYGSGAGQWRSGILKGFGGRELTTTVLAEPSGKVLVGGRGLFEYRGEHLQSLDTDRLPTTSEVYLLHEDREGWLWIGTQRGLMRRRGDTWQNFGTSDGLASAWVRTCVERRNGGLWFGTNGGGIAIWRDGRFEELGTAQGLIARAVRGMYEDERGVMWVATEGLGLARIELAEGQPVARAKVTMIRAKDGLYDDALHAIVSDDNGFLWISTNRGILRTRRSGLDDFAAGRATRVYCSSFTEADGMKNRECNGQSSSSAVRTRDGHLWFANREGVVIVDPAQANRDLPPPPAVIEELTAGGRRFSGQSAPARLALGHRDLSIEYTGLSLRSPQDLRFRYRLVGFDRDWNDVGNRRTAIYTKVPPGNYTFEVTANLPDDDRSAETARVAIVVPPYFYETWWFRLLAAALVLAGAVAFVRWRIGALERRERDLAAQVAARTRDLVAQTEQTERARSEAEDARDAAQRSLETIEEQAVELRDLNEARSRFFANVSHELRTPLTLTIGPIEDLLAGLHGPLRDDASAQLQLALRSSNRVLRQVNQLLDLARAESGGMKLRARPVDPAAIARELVVAFAPVAERRGVTLVAELATSPAAESAAEPVPGAEVVFADPLLLEQAIANLMSNAVRHTPAGGRVTISVAYEAPAESPGRVLLAVADTGVGIAEADRDRIFERFYQAGNGAQRGFPSTGIGLSLTREILLLHGGGIEMESTVGVGSTFTAWIPTGRTHLSDEQVVSGEPDASPAAAPWFVADAVAPEVASAASAAHHAADAGNRDDATTVLVVEDDSEVRAYLARHLRDAYRVIEAEDGEAGLATARRDLPDLVVSDVMMPKMGGFEMCTAIKRDPETEFIPVILLTAMAGVENRIAGLELGADDYLGKPFHARELLTRVRNLIGLRRRLRDRLVAIAGPADLHPAPVEATAADTVFLDRVRQAVEARLGDEQFSVRELAREIGMDRTQLYRRLQPLTGEGPEELIRRFRLERAEQLLKARAGSVGEIAYAVGFKSVAHFCKCFRDRTGASPGAWAAEAAGRA